jgi:hypothetical protein
MTIDYRATGRILSFKSALLPDPPDNPGRWKQKRRVILPFPRVTIVIRGTTKQHKELNRINPPCTPDRVLLLAASCFSIILHFTRGGILMKDMTFSTI